MSKYGRGKRRAGKQHAQSRESRLRADGLREHAAYRRDHCPLVGSEAAKRAYSSYPVALRAAAQMHENYGKPMYAYRCRCGSFHLTSQPQPVERRTA